MTKLSEMLYNFLKGAIATSDLARTRAVREGQSAEAAYRQGQYDASVACRDELERLESRGPVSLAQSNRFPIRILWRGSVSDLVTDIASEMTQREFDELRDRLAAGEGKDKVKP